MTPIRSLLLCLALCAPAAAAAGTFGGERNITGNASLGSQFPEVAYHSGAIHVVWVGYAPGLLGDIYYACSANDGGTFGTPINLTAGTAQAATGSAGNDRPQVTAGPNGVFVGFNTNNDTGEVFVRRAAGTGCPASAASFGAAQQLSNSGASYYSRITDLFTDSAGRVHLAYFDNSFTAGASGQIRHRVACDGTTWQADTAVTDRNRDGDVDNEEPRLGEAGGRIYVAFRSSRNGDPQGGWAPNTVVLQSTAVSGGCTTAWSYPGRRLAGGLPFTYSSTYRPEIFGDSGGKLHLAWWDNTRGANVQYRSHNVATGLFGVPQTISNFGLDHLEPGGLGSTPALTQGGFQAPPAFASNGTTAFIGYQKNETLHPATVFEKGPIYLRESANNGTTWGAEQAIATSSQATTPRFALGGTGNQNVAIVWTDIRSGTAQIYFRIYTLGAVSGGPSFGLSPPTLAFGNQAVGSTSASQALTLVNTGSAGAINSITVTGDYALASGTTCAVGAVGAGGSCTIRIAFGPKALGSRAGSVTVSTDAFDSPSTATFSGTGVPSATFAANVSAVITGYYETILGRSPDSGGLAFWTSEANRVVALGADVREVFFAMSIQFFSSAEYAAKNASDTQYLTDLYRTFFIREPDGPGLAFWQGELNAGISRSALLMSFLFSAEFSNQMTTLFGTVSVRPEVNMTIDLFRGALGRLPDDAGFAFWLGRIRTAQCQGAADVSAEVNSLAGLFFTSPEYGARARSTPDFVGDLYNAFLRRGPGGDSAGYNFWVSQITGGAQTRDQVRSAFTPSAEFQARVAAVIAAGCFTP